MTSYALITAAHNEEAYIGKTLSSVTSQTVLPAKWIIVSDGSTDRTDEIVRRYAREFAFIHLLRREKHSPRDFASKVFALNAAMKMIENEDYPFVGHLDADISFGPNYFFELFRKFEEDPLLGLAGGFIYEEVNGRFMPIRATALYRSLVPSRCSGRSAIGTLVRSCRYLTEEKTGMPKWLPGCAGGG